MKHDKKAHTSVSSSLPETLLITQARQLKSLPRILLICLFLLLVGSAPWLIMALNPASATLSWSLIGLAIAGLILLILDLAVFGTISKVFGQQVNAYTTKSNFSIRRLAYLLFVYLTPISAVLGLLAWGR